MCRFTAHPPAGTGPEVFGNTNAPPAVTHSAIIYALRCMVSWFWVAPPPPRHMGAGLEACRSTSQCFHLGRACTYLRPACAASSTWNTLPCCCHRHCLQVTRDIPLNHGCMAPITVRIPKGAWAAGCVGLMPSEAAAGRLPRTGGCHRSPPCWSSHLSTAIDAVGSS